MSQGCSVTTRTSTGIAQEQDLPTKPLLKSSIIEHFAALTRAIEKLDTFHETLRRGPTEDLLLFQEHAELYRISLSNQWQNLQSSLGWLRVDREINVKRCQESDHSSESIASDQEESSPVDVETNTSSSVWVDCPIPIFEQVAYVYQALEERRLQMEDLRERIYELEERCEVNIRP